MKTQTQATMGVTMVKKETMAVSVPVELQGSWGSEGIDTADILIPKVLLMQPMSDLVAQDKAKVGDLVKSTTKEILAGKDKSFEFIPIQSFKTWILEQKVGQKFEFRGVEPMNAANKEEPMEWTQDGSEWRRNRCLNFYALLTVDIAREQNAMKIAQSGAMPDPDDALLPIVISFQRTGYQSGKELITHFAKAQHFGVAPAVTTFKMKSFMEKNDKGTYYVPMVEKSEKTPADYLPICKKWHETLNRAPVKVDVEAEAI